MVYYNILGIFIIRGVGGFIIRGRGLLGLGFTVQGLGLMALTLVVMVLVDVKCCNVGTLGCMRRHYIPLRYGQSRVGSWGSGYHCRKNY